MKFLVLILSSLPLWAQASEIKLIDEKMTFRYVVLGDGKATACSHKRIRDLPDWEVTCGEKKFAAHIVIHEYQSVDQTRTAFEILYWVTDRNFTTPEFHSGSTWIRLKKATLMESLMVSQSVENDYASLDMEWAP